MERNNFNDLKYCLCSPKVLKCFDGQLVTILLNKEYYGCRLCQKPIKLSVWNKYYKKDK